VEGTCPREEVFKGKGREKNSSAETGEKMITSSSVEIIFLGVVVRGGFRDGSLKGDRGED